MFILKFLSVVSIILNIILVFIILIRSPNEQSLQEIIGSLSIFESSRQAENTIDRVLQILVIFYFIFGLLFNLKYFF